MHFAIPENKSEWKHSQFLLILGKEKSGDARDCQDQEFHFPQKNNV